MRKSHLIAGLAAAALLPSLAAPSIVWAQERQTCESQRATQVAGTVAGAVIGGVIGNQVAGRGNRAEGTAIGLSLIHI